MAVAAVTICRNHDRARFGGRDLRTHGTFTLFSLCALIRLPCVVGRLPLLDFAGTPINPVTVDGRNYLRIAAAFGVVDFAENKFEISVVASSVP
jgi:hypothetical protein